MPEARSPTPSDVRPAPPPATCQGAHLICELYGARRLTEVDHVSETLQAAAQRCGARILATRLHPFQEHGGVTGVVLLAESHVTIHTWPEHDYAAIDVFLCGDCDPKASLPVFERAFAPERMQHQLIERGVKGDPAP